MNRLLLALLIAHCEVATAGFLIVDKAPAATQPKLVITPAPESQKVINPVPVAVKPAPALPRAAMPLVELEQWEIKAGASLRTTLENWCERAGYRLLWNVEGGFRSQGGFISEGAFRKAVKDLFAAVPQDLHLEVDITQNKLVIVSRGGK